MILLACFASLFLLLIFSGKINRFFFKRKSKKNGFKWSELDSYIPKLDEEKKEIDGPYYKEGKFIVISSELCSVTTEDRSLVRWITRLIYKRHDFIKVYSSDNIRGKLVYDRGHARRYIESFRYAPSYGA